MRPSWFKISAILAGLWLVVGSAMYGLGEMRPSPDKVISFAAAHPMGGKKEAERMKIVEAVSAEYRRLDFDQSRELLNSPELRQWWTPLHEQERRSFRLAIFPQSKQVAGYFDKLPIQERSRHLKRMLTAVKARNGEDALSKVSAPMLAGLAVTGLTPIIKSSMLDQDFDILLMLHELERRFVWSTR